MTSEIHKWILKNYPNKEIDWKAEFERLLGITEQTLPVLAKLPTNKTISDLTANAVETGFGLLEFYEQQTLKGNTNES